MFLYEKVLLYAYPHIEPIIESIDSSITRKAIYSYRDLSPTYNQAETIIDMMEQKKKLIDLKVILDQIIKKFCDDDLIYFEYKYFKRKRKSYFANFDFSSRQYFRKQIKLAKQFKKYLEQVGITEEFYDKTYGEIDFLKRLGHRVFELENMCYKNKKKNKPQIKLNEKTNKQINKIAV